MWQVAVRVERAGSMAQGEKGKEIKEPLLMVKGFFIFRQCDYA